MPLTANWTPEEDVQLRQLVEEHGPKKWSLIAQKLETKGSKQCRRRWKNYLNADLKKGGWSVEEDRILIEGHRLHGNKWTEIAKLVGGRTDNAVKNRWAALCKRNQRLSRGQATSNRGRKSKLAAPGNADPSQVLAEHHQALASQQMQQQQMQQLHTSNKRTSPRFSLNPSVFAEPPAKRRQLDGGRSSPQGQRRFTSPQQNQRVANMVRSPGSGSRHDNSAGYSGRTHTTNTTTSSGSRPPRRPDLNIVIPNNTADPPSQPQVGMEIRVLKDLLTPCEIQYAQELNDMELPLQIALDEEPPLSTSRNAAQMAMNQLASPGGTGMMDFNDLFRWFQSSGLTPRSTTGQEHQGFNAQPTPRGLTASQGLPSPRPMTRSMARSPAGVLSGNPSGLAGLSNPFGGNQYPGSAQRGGNMAGPSSGSRGGQGGSMSGYGQQYQQGYGQQQYQESGHAYQQQQQQNHYQQLQQQLHQQQQQYQQQLRQRQQQQQQQQQQQGWNEQQGYRQPRHSNGITMLYDANTNTTTEYGASYNQGAGGMLEIHDGHRQLVAKLLASVKNADLDLQSDLARAGQLLKTEQQALGMHGLGHEEEHIPMLPPAPPSTRSRSRSQHPGPAGALSLNTFQAQQHQQQQQLLLSPSLASLNSGRGWPVLVTPHFTQDELAMLLDALNSDEVVNGLPPAM